MSNLQHWAYQLQIEERRFKYELATRRGKWLAKLKECNENLEKIRYAINEDVKANDHLIKEN